MSLNPYTVVMIGLLDGQRNGVHTAEVYAPTPTLAARQNRFDLSMELGVPQSDFVVAAVYEGHFHNFPEDAYERSLDNEGYELEVRRQEVALFMVDNPEVAVPGATQDASGIKILNLSEAYAFVLGRQWEVIRAEEV